MTKEQEAAQILEKHCPIYNPLFADPKVKVFKANTISAMQEFGNQRFNAALSEAIEKVKEKVIDYNARFVIKILEGLKIKP